MLRRNYRLNEKKRSVSYSNDRDDTKSPKTSQQKQSLEAAYATFLLQESAKKHLCTPYHTFSVSAHHSASRARREKFSQIPSIVAAHSQSSTTVRPHGPCKRKEHGSGQHIEKRKQRSKHSADASSRNILTNDSLHQSSRKSALSVQNCVT